MTTNESPEKFGRDPDAPTNVAPPRVIRTREEALTYEYLIAYLDKDGGIGMVDYRYRYFTREAAQRRRDILLDRPHTKIVRRLVGPWEEA